MAVKLSVFILLACLAVAFIAVAVRGDEDLTAPLEYCSSLPMNDGQPPHSFVYTGFCYRFYCNVTRDSNGYTTGHLRTTTCDDVSAIHPCTINRGNPLVMYPECCPFRECPPHSRKASN